MNPERYCVCCRVNSSSEGSPSWCGSAGMVLGQHGNSFEACRVAYGRNSGRERSIEHIDTCIYALPSSNVGMGSGKLELPYRVPKLELGNQQAI
jgi:hypothetical protein